MMLLCEIPQDVYFQFHPFQGSGIFLSLGMGWYSDRRGVLRGPAPDEVVWLYTRKE